MVDTTRGFIAWGITVFVTCILSFCVYMWLSNVARFENRKKEIAAGIFVCALAVASLMFLPILFCGFNLNSLGKQLVDSIPFEQFDGAENFDIKSALAPFIAPLATSLAALSLRYVKIIVIGVPALVSLLIIVLTGAIFKIIREPKKQQKTEYSRKHLFEYNGEIVSSLNKKK